MDASSIAESYFRDLLAKGVGLFGFLNELGSASPPATETEWLDFKGAAKIQDADVQKYWSKALAGFGTTQGGVLIWGLDCRKQGDPAIDRVIGPSYVANPRAFKSRLVELHHMASDPPIGGVEVEVIEDPDDKSRGFVVCYIPESALKPARAEYAGRQFYVRIGDDFVVPGTALLRALFVPNSNARLSVLMRMSERSSQVIFNVKNEGLVMVKHFMLVVDFPMSPGDKTPILMIGPNITAMGDDVDGTYWHISLGNNSNEPLFPHAVQQFHVNFKYVVTVSAFPKKMRDAGITIYADSALPVTATKDVVASMKAWV